MIFLTMRECHMATHSISKENWEWLGVTNSKRKQWSINQSSFFSSYYIITTTDIDQFEQQYYDTHTLLSMSIGLTTHLKEDILIKSDNIK